MATKRSSSSDKKVLSDDHVAVSEGDESDVVVGPPRRRSVAGFLVKIYDIFNDPKHAEYCGWGENGGESSAAVLCCRPLLQSSDAVLCCYAAPICSKQQLCLTLPARRFNNCAQDERVCI